MKQYMKSIPVLGALLVWLHKYMQDKRRIDRLRKRTKVSPLRIVVGSSGIYDPGWIDTDVEDLNLLNPKHWKTYFKRKPIDAILAEHVWEHLTAGEGIVAAKRCFEFLKPGAYMRVAVPDGFHPDEEYIDNVKPGGIGAGSDDHKVLYDHITLTDCFEKADFRVELLEYFDSEGKFHYVNWRPEEGMVRRSRRFDERNNAGRLKYTSLILDAHKHA